MNKKNWKVLQTKIHYNLEDHWGYTEVIFKFRFTLLDNSFDKQCS